MASKVLPLGNNKPPNYFEHPRLELVERLPRPYGRVLDVGCGAGAFGAELLKRGATSVTGIELDKTAAARAKERGYEVVLVGDAEGLIATLNGPFATILCHDVLEHLFRPDIVLREAAELAGPGATLSVSIPNARHVSLLCDLIFRGTFGYEVEGHRDSTHVRWFTRKDVIALVEESGWQVVRVRWPDSRRYWPLKYVGQLPRDFACRAWQLLAIKPHPF